jgi:glycosyltransferase involved in cell wall biosynthesis
MAVLLARRLHAPWLFDLRGLLAQEYVDAEHWRRGGLSHRITERAERSLLAAADGVVVLTRAIHRELVETGALSAEAISAVIPCAVDLDEFRPEPSRRALWRHRLGVGDEPLLVYSGTLGSWYRPSEMIDFWLAAREQVPGLRFLFLTPQVEAARQLVRARDLEGQTIIQSAAPYEVPGCLAACDAGICFLAPVPSKRASTPTKYGEYLGAGLPIVVDAWTGDVAHLASSDAVITLPRFDAPAYAAAAKTLAQRLRRGAAATADPLALAAREFALPTAVDRYHHIYRSMVERRGQRAAAGRTR